MVGDLLTDLVNTHNNTLLLLTPVLRDNELIIRDDKSSVDMEFSFDENSCDSKDFIVNGKSQYSKSEISHGQNMNNNIVDQYNKNKTKCDIQKFKDFLQTSSSSASSEDLSKKFSFRKKIRKRRDTREKARHYKVNITRLNNNWSLHESTGEFYYCRCRDDQKKGCSNDIKINSDTESASDTSKISNYNYNPKVFCSKCGNGYREESMLIEHMKIHETHCRVCNEIFPTEQTFKQHIQTHLFKVFVCHICNYEFPVKAMLHRHLDYHVEDSIMESVIDMEEDYNLTPCPMPNMNYQTSITNILHYLGDTNDI
ncbi:hypothetical protein GWI33_021881 [Rhynchophorus ferrugineus]|uniref:C2H2-type domain-containing protein n=1 Tax=Rhynchophorus ferrugineus TaxID=354439 RepID=A0A834IQU9_RHYFE|nr:hypothetical protein GWI33_021881 [Rhynchophorus ferrugineus]